MPVIRSDAYDAADEDDRKLARRRGAVNKLASLAPKPVVVEPDAESPRVAQQSNATGQLLDLSEAAARRGEDWREKGAGAADESEYTRLGLDDDPEEDHLHEKTQYLFDDDKGMTPLSQMQATKGLLSEGQRIAYVGMCRLVVKDMVQALRRGKHKELEAALASVDHWSSKIMTRLYQHMDVDASGAFLVSAMAWPCRSRWWYQSNE